MMNSVKGYSVHLLTALGAPVSMLALLAAARGAWREMFAWLLLALVIDGVDGPLARRWNVSRTAPRVDGVILDLVIDYLTYVFIPTFALLRSGLLPGGWGYAALLLIMAPSALYFAWTGMKTRDGSFSGFPGCFNMLALAIFAAAPEPWVSVSVIAVLSGAMFVPLRFVHPVRTKRWRKVTLPVAMLWTGAGAWACWTGFPTEGALHFILMATSIYLLCAGIVQQILSPASERWS